MKWLLLIFLILGLFTSYGYAQMAGQNSEMGRGMMDWGYGIGGVGVILITLLAIVLILRNRLFNQVPLQQVSSKIRAMGTVHYH